MNNKTENWQGLSIKEFILLIYENIFLYAGAVLAVIITSIFLLYKPIPVSFTGKIRVSVAPFVNALNSAKSTSSRLIKTNAIQGVQINASPSSIENALHLMEFSDNGRGLFKSSSWLNDRNPSAILQQIAVTNIGNNNYDISIKDGNEEFIKEFLPFLLNGLEDDLNASVRDQISKEIEGLESYLRYETENLMQLQSELKKFQTDSGYLIHLANQKSYEYVIRLLDVMIPKEYLEFVNNTSFAEFETTVKINDTISKELTFQYRQAVKDMLVKMIYLNSLKNEPDLSYESIQQASDAANQAVSNVVTKYRNHLSTLGYNEESADRILNRLRYLVLHQESGYYQNSLEELDELKRVVGKYNIQFTNAQNVIVEYERQIQYLKFLLNSEDLKIERVGGIGINRDVAGFEHQITLLAIIFFAFGFGVVVVLVVDALRATIDDAKTIKKLIRTDIPPIYELSGKNKDERCIIETLEDLSSKNGNVFAKMSGQIRTISSKEVPQVYTYVALGKAENNECDLLNICYSIGIDDKKVCLVDPVGSQIKYESIISQYSPSLSEQDRRIQLSTLNEKAESKEEDARIIILLRDGDNSSVIANQGLSDAIRYMKKPLDNVQFQLVNGSSYQNSNELLNLIINTNGVIISLQRKKSLRKAFSVLIDVLRAHDIPILGVLIKY